MLDVDRSVYIKKIKPYSMVVCLAVDARIYTPLFDYQTVACLAWTMMVNLLSSFTLTT